VKIAIQRKKVAWKEWLKDTNNEASARVFSRWEKVYHNIIRCEKLRYIRNIIDYRVCNTRLGQTGPKICIKRMSAHNLFLSL